jgi:hypothetical protein
MLHDCIHPNAQTESNRRRAIESASFEKFTNSGGKKEWAATHIARES